MMKCSHCPVGDLQIECMAQRSNHTPMCEAVSPESPRFNSKMASIIIKGSIDLHNKREHPELIPVPGIGRKINNLIEATVKAGAASLGGAYIASTPQEYTARLYQCQTCDFRSKDDRWVCEHPSCGCKLKIKAGISTEKCPIGLWEKESLVNIQQIPPSSLREIIGGDCGCNKS